jgi:transcriptional regulator with XRE-family HTH domain
MNYSSLGKLIRSEREKRGWEQADLASRIKIGQQAVSRWENGNSRPRLDDLHKLVDIFSGDIEVWKLKAGYILEEPDISLAPYLPLNNLSSENFELFCRDLVQFLNPTAEVHRYGSQGYKQEGIDLFAKYMDKSVNDYQCKRHIQFGPADIDSVVKVTTIKSKKHHLLLTRRATPNARKAINKYIGWALWDIEDISAKIRSLPPDKALLIVDTYFPGWRKRFLNIDEPSPWLIPKQFFLPLENKLKLFTHGWGLVGRKTELEKFKEFETQSDFQSIILSGRGGIGKSRLLKAWADGLAATVDIRFLSSSPSIEMSDVELLPVGPSYLVIDDAHERGDLDVILNGVARVRPELKVILSTRLYGISKLQDELNRSGMSYDSDKIIKLTDLEVDNAEALSKEILLDPSVKGDVGLARKIAEITKDCPLATVVGSRLVGQGIIKPELLNNEKKFRDTLLSSFKDVIAGELGGKEPDKMRQLLDFLATIQPFNSRDPKFQSSAEKILDDHFDVIIRNMGILEDAGVLLRRGNHLRVIPDLLADYIRFKAAYEEKIGRSTGYVDRVFKHLQDDLAINLLVNISQLDWRLSANNAQSTLLDAIWQQIFSELEAANHSDRTFLLKKLKDAAYYQPQRFLSLVEYLKNSPSKTPEDPKFAGLYKYTHQDVLKELPEILRRICYHLDYLPRCVDLMWEIARGDLRQTNPHPEHGLRILQDMAQYDIYELTGKSVRINELMLEAIKRWLSDSHLPEYTHSPLDVLDKLLDKSSTTDTYEHGKITFHSFSVHYENTKHIREEALKLVVEAAKSVNLVVSLRAIKSLSHALSEPTSLFGRQVTSEEVTRWQTFQKEVLDDIEDIVKVQKHPLIFVELKDILVWHAQHSHSEEIKKRARTLFDSLSESFEVKLVQAVDQNRDRDWFIDEEKYDYHKAMDMSLKFRQEVVDAFVKKYTASGTGFEELDRMIQELEDCGKNPFPITFCAEMAKRHPEYVIGVCEEVIKHPESALAQCYGYFIFGLIEIHQTKTAKLLQSALKTNREKLHTAIADYYWRGRWVDYFNEDVDIPNLELLTNSRHHFVKKLAIGGLGRLGKKKPETTKKLLLSLNLGIEKDVGGEYFEQFDKKYYFDPDLLSDTELESVINKLEIINDIDDYHIEEFLNYASARLPLVVIKLLIKRIELSKARKTGEKYQPLSYSSKTLLKGFNSNPYYKDVLREVRNKILDRTWQTGFWVPKLFKSVSNNFDDVGVAILLEWIDSGKKERLEGIGKIIEDAPENYIFQHPDFVTKMFSAAKPYGPDFLKSVRNSLVSSTVFRSKHGTPGQPMPEDVELKENSEKMLLKYSRGSLEYELFESLLRHAKREIDDQLKEDRELLE